LQAPVQLGALTSETDWLELRETLELNGDVSVLHSLLETFRSIGARSFILETAYIDRDFSAAYSAFYASLFHPFLKYCRRIHFFGEDLTSVAEAETAEGASRDLEAKNDAYLGFAVLRPISHAPVGSAVVASNRLETTPSVQIDVRAEYRVHLLGADLSVYGFPLTQQDRRVGACAQATIWMVGRHIHRKHGGPWFSMPEINEVALKPTDTVTSRSLPAGSDFLTPDNMVRALRAMDRHPIVYAAQFDDRKQPIWTTPVHEIVSRYLDSGIPVILGLSARDGGAVGHAVVAVGRMIVERLPATVGAQATWAESATHLLVHDDQRGAYRELPVRGADRIDDYPWTLDDALYAIVPLPAKVFMTAEIAETLARDYLATLMDRAPEYRERARAAIGADPLGPIERTDPSFFAAGADGLVARTYLTFGWKYKRRALRNRLPAAFKAELMRKDLPRYVWVTEFSLPGDLEGYDPCGRKARAHVVVDATGSLHWDSVPIVQMPGLSMFWSFNPASPIATKSLVWRATDDAEPFQPKVRGWSDFDRCDLPATGSQPPRKPSKT